jgi:hypothetical protein
MNGLSEVLQPGDNEPLLAGRPRQPPEALKEPGGIPQSDPEVRRAIVNARRQTASASSGRQAFRSGACAALGFGLDAGE